MQKTLGTWARGYSLRAAIADRTASWRRMRVALGILFLLSLNLPLACAQFPKSAGSSVAIEGSVGYEYFNQSIASSQRLNLNGVDGTISVDIKPLFGLCGDFGYARASNVFGTAHSSNVFNYLGGPVFYPLRGKRVTAYAHGLFGGARVAGAVPGNGGAYLVGFANGFSWAAGGGIEYRYSPSWAVRAGADYLHASFYNLNVELQGQGNFRTVVSLVYSFGKGHR